MYKRVLVPLDGSSLAEAALPFILQIAEPLDLEVVLVRVMPRIMPLAIEGTRHFMPDDVAARLKEAREYLASVATDLRGHGCAGDDRRSARGSGDGVGGRGARNRGGSHRHDDARPERDQPVAVRLGRGSGAAAGRDPRADDAAHDTGYRAAQVA